jgi:hypothetical protein
MYLRSAHMCVLLLLLCALILLLSVLVPPLVPRVLVYVRVVLVPAAVSCVRLPALLSGVPRSSSCGACVVYYASAAARWCLLCARGSAVWRVACLLLLFHMGRAHTCCCSCVCRARAHAGPGILFRARVSFAIVSCMVASAAMVWSRMDVIWRNGLGCICPCCCSLLLPLCCARFAAVLLLCQARVFSCACGVFCRLLPLRACTSCTCHRLLLHVCRAHAPAAALRVVSICFVVLLARARSAVAISWSRLLQPRLSCPRLAPLPCACCCCSSCCMEFALFPCLHPLFFSRTAVALCVVTTRPRVCSASAMSCSPLLLLSCSCCHELVPALCHVCCCVHRASVGPAYPSACLRCWMLPSAALTVLVSLHVHVLCSRCWSARVCHCCVLLASAAGAVVHLSAATADVSCWSCWCLLCCRYYVFACAAVSCPHRCVVRARIRDVPFLIASAVGTCVFAHAGLCWLCRSRVC